MKLLNVGQRDFVTPYGVWRPMEIIEIPEDKAEEYLCYGNEVKVLEAAKEASAENTEAAEVSKGTKKTKKAK